MSKVYRFSAEERKIYESCEFPVAAYQYLDGEVITLLVSDGYCKLKGKKRDELVRGHNESMFVEVHPEDAGRIAVIGLGFAKRESDYDVIYRTKCGGDEDYHVIHAVGIYQTMSDGVEIPFVYYADITLGGKKVQELLDQYYNQANDMFYIDALTKLPNINYYHAFAHEKLAAIRAAEKVPAVVYFDIIGMGAVNSKHGYKVGDRLLRDMANILRDVFPTALVARVADDHFIVITIKDKIASMIDEVKDAFNKVTPGRNVGFRSGLAILSNLDTDPTMALDQACYANKAIGSDRRVLFRQYSPAMEAERRKEDYVLECFKKAMDENWIKVFYQCIKDFPTGKIYALEALARWIDPERGMLSASEFIHVLERNHLIYQLDMYMAEQVLSEIEPRRECGLEIIPVSVNFSAEDFEQGNLPEQIAALLKKYNAEPWMIAIEITERDFSNVPGSFKRQLKALRDMGVEIWVDDFGSGYSSLSVMHQFSFDLLKIDRSFIENLEENDGYNKILVKAIVEVGHNLNLKVLAEGIESEGGAVFLEKVGCDYGQGFHYMKPMSFAAIKKEYIRIGNMIEVLPYEKKK